jgi:hypothetical protein
MTTNYGTILIGRLNLREAITTATDANSAGQSAAGRTLVLSGQEMYSSFAPTAGLSQAGVAAVEDDLAGMVNAGSIQPVQFTNKTDRNGYFVVSDQSCNLVDWPGPSSPELITLDWKTTLMRVGTDTEVDLESRLTGATARNNSFSATGERWHCPPIGHYGYWSGPSQPSTVTRTGSDGAMTVYRRLQTSINPRWGCAVANYLNGRVRFIDSNALERSGINYSVGATGWTLSNSLVQVTPLTSSGVLQVSAYTGGAWQNKAWDVLSAGTTLGPPTACTVLRNEAELIVVRLLWTQAPGRVTLDLTLRRGSRFVEVYVQGEFSATLTIQRFSAEAGTAGTGYVAATTNDAVGNRYIVGSAKTFSNLLTQGGIQLASTTMLDAFIGVIVGGSGAVAGDVAGDLYAQYLGAPSELVQAVRR